MLQIRGARDLLHEAINPKHCREFGSQDLHRHFAFVLEVFGEADGGQLPISGISGAQ